jgi:hypothetical protein
MTPRRFPPPWSVEELDACFVVTPAVRRGACVYYENERRRKIKEGDIMKRTFRAFAVATLICAAAYERSHAAATAPLTGIQAGSSNITLVYSPRYRIVVPLTRRYSYQPTGGRKASIIGLPLAWNVGGIGVKEAAVGRSTAACQNEARRIAPNITKLSELVRKD